MNALLHVGIDRVTGFEPVKKQYVLGDEGGEGMSVIRLKQFGFT